jgi:hypothetical protein
MVAGVFAVGAALFAATPSYAQVAEGATAGPGGGLLADYKYIVEDAVANALGVTVEEVQAAKEDGTFRELVEASGLTRDDLRTVVEEARQEMINQALADGVITQEQADQIQSRGPGGHRGGGRPGGNRGSGNGQPPAEPGA